jgi:hypothetical protein
MGGLTFIDASCIRMILDAARGLATPRKVALQCHPGIAARFVLSGAADVPSVSLVTVHDR